MLALLETDHHYCEPLLIVLMLHNQQLSHEEVEAGLSCTQNGVFDVTFQSRSVARCRRRPRPPAPPLREPERGERRRADGLEELI